GEVLSQTIQKSSVQKIYGGIYSLHMAPFAQPLVRVALFISGILGCLMIASGLLLWSLKRQLKNKHNTFHFGHYMVNRFNVSALV
ncbi:PepSY-associated TM helix domain-containing protein, partial [Pseudomonas syringae]